MDIRMLPSWGRWGVTSGERRAWTKVVFAPDADTWLNGSDTPWLIRAVLLSSVVTLGAEMVFTVPSVSAADRRRFRVSAPPAEPKTKPSAPPVPTSPAAPTFTAKLGFRGKPHEEPPTTP